MPTATGIAGPGCAAALGTTIAPTATMHDNTAASQRRCTGGPPPTMLVPTPQPRRRFRHTALWPPPVCRVGERSLRQQPARVGDPTDRRAADDLILTIRRPNRRGPGSTRSKAGGRA